MDPELDREWNNYGVKIELDPNDDDDDNDRPLFVITTDEGLIYRMVAQGNLPTREEFNELIAAGVDLRGHRGAGRVTQVNFFDGRKEQVGFIRVMRHECSKRTGCLPVPCDHLTDSGDQQHVCIHDCRHNKTGSSVEPNRYGRAPRGRASRDHHDTLTEVLFAHRHGGYAEAVARVRMLLTPQVVQVLRDYAECISIVT